LAGWPVKMWRSSLQGTRKAGDARGQTLVLCLDPKEQRRGDCSTPNISEWPNDAAVVSWSQVLERGSIPRQYFLTSKACAGILRRAEARARTLPPVLYEALTAVATSTTH
jgi:hypothetical protein